MADEREPLKESVDYPEFVTKFVKDKLAAMDLQTTDEKTLYIAQDIESYLLDVGKKVADLDQTEMHHIQDFIRERA
jgi:hypothetical protein